MSDPRFNLDLVREFLAGYHYAKYVSVACLTLLVYDHILCLDEEIRFFWRGRWTGTRILYFLNRYLALGQSCLRFTTLFLPQPTLLFCEVAVELTTALIAVEIIIVELILFIRVWNMYTYSPIWRAFLAVFSVVQFLPSLALAIYIIVRLEFISSPFTDTVFTGCLYNGPTGGFLWGIYPPFFAFETVLLIMTIAHAYRAVRREGSTPLLKCLVKDGSLYYAALFIPIAVCTVGNVLPWVNVSTPVNLSNFFVVSISVSTSRLLLSVRSLSHIPSDELDPTGTIRRLKSIELRRLETLRALEREQQNNLKPNTKSKTPRTRPENLYPQSPAGARTYHYHKRSESHQPVRYPASVASTTHEGTTEDGHLGRLVREEHGQMFVHVSNIATDPTDTEWTFHSDEKWTDDPETIGLGTEDVTVDPVTGRLRRGSSSNSSIAQSRYIGRGRGSASGHGSPKADLPPPLPSPSISRATGVRETRVGTWDVPRSNQSQTSVSVPAPISPDDRDSFDSLPMGIPALPYNAPFTTYHPNTSGASGSSVPCSSQQQVHHHAKPPSSWRRHG